MTGRIRARSAAHLFLVLVTRERVALHAASHAYSRVARTALPSTRCAGVRRGLVRSTRECDGCRACACGALLRLAAEAEARSRRHPASPAARAAHPRRRLPVLHAVVPQRLHCRRWSPALAFCWMAVAVANSALRQSGSAWPARESADPGLLWLLVERIRGPRARACKVVGGAILQTLQGYGFPPRGVGRG